MTLGKTERLKSRKRIEEIFRVGRHFSLFPFRILYQFTALPVPLQAGFGVSGKRFGKAVDRNRVRRLTREAWRLEKHVLQDTLLQGQQQLMVFLIYTGKDLPEFSNIRGKMNLIITKLIQLTHENHPTNS